jgi:hypothetical protein
MPTQKVMCRYKQINNIYRVPILAQPKILLEAKALCECGFEVEDLTDDLKKDYLEIIEMDIDKFFDRYPTYKDLPEGMDYWNSFKDIMDEFQEHGEIWISAQEGRESYYIPRHLLDEIFWNEFKERNKRILYDKVEIYQIQHNQVI